MTREAYIEDEDEPVDPMPQSNSIPNGTRETALTTGTGIMVDELDGGKRSHPQKLF